MGNGWKEKSILHSTIYKFWQIHFNSSHKVFSLLPKNGRFLWNVPAIIWTLEKLNHKSSIRFSFSDLLLCSIGLITKEIFIFEESAALPKAKEKMTLDFFSHTAVNLELLLDQLVSSSSTRLKLKFGCNLQLTIYWNVFSKRWQEPILTFVSLLCERWNIYIHYGVILEQSLYF